VNAPPEGPAPDVYLFNPFAEGFLASGPSFAPVKTQAQLARDLANLPQCLGRQNDLVLVPSRPAAPFLHRLKLAGIPLPEFVETHADLAAMPADPETALEHLTGRPLGVLRPWAWGPESVAWLAPLFALVTAERRTPSQRFNETIAKLYSKAWSAALLRAFLAQQELSPPARHEAPPANPSTPRVPDAPSADPWLCTEAEVGVAVGTLDDALDAIAAIRRRGHHRVVAKQALGLAGQSAIRLWEPELSDPQRRWLARALRGGGHLVIEPWPERVTDFSVHWEMTPRGIRLCGYTGLLTDHRGQYQANWAEPHHRQRPPHRLPALLGQAPDLIDRIQRLYDDLAQTLESALQRADYLGPIGLDAFVYRDHAGRHRLKPIVEINPRYTMGRVLLELMKNVCPESSGLLRLVNRLQARVEGHSDFLSYARRLEERHPLQREGGPGPHLREGALCLNDPERAQVVLAVLHVGQGVDG